MIGKRKSRKRKKERRRKIKMYAKDDNIYYMYRNTAYWTLLGLKVSSEST